MNASRMAAQTIGFIGVLRAGSMPVRAPDGERAQRFSRERARRHLDRVHRYTRRPFGAHMRIAELYRRKRPVFSFEFFPPRTDAGVDALFRALGELAVLGPDFVSVTCPLDKPR